MSRYIADQHHATGQGRLRNFTRTERESGVHPAILKLNQRPAPPDEKSRRMAEFLRIARGRLT
ncbi:MAG: hypothetical protein P3W90_003940 [Paracoccus sp. (in: a-proteobacteria)]|nr:hypothetical protein [Paracoccus sp. (in: a-proteobacteria)]